MNELNNKIISRKAKIAGMTVFIILASALIGLFLVLIYI